VIAIHELPWKGELSMRCPHLTEAKAAMHSEEYTYSEHRDQSQRVSAGKGETPCLSFWEGDPSRAELSWFQIVPSSLLDRTVWDRSKVISSLLREASRSISRTHAEMGLHLVRAFSGSKNISTHMMRRSALRATTVATPCAYTCTVWAARLFDGGGGLMTRSVKRGMQGKERTTTSLSKCAWPTTSRSSCSRT
jgi:hypothetical protein